MTDMVDDLHAAEDHIGRLEQAILVIGASIAISPDVLGVSLRDAVSIALEGFCRPSCEGRSVCSDGACGCPCHGDDQ